MIVLCDGMQRSGSTWAFNVCVKLLRVAYPRATVGSEFTQTPGELMDKLDARYDHFVVKTHRTDYLSLALSSAGAVKVVYTHRDPYDAVASLMRMFDYPFESALRAVSASLALYEFHREHGEAMILSYAALTGEPRETIREIARYLELDLPAPAIGRVDRETSVRAMKAAANRVGKKGSPFVVRKGGDIYDTRTLLHPNHLRNGANGYGRKMLSRGQQQSIGRMLRGLAPYV